MGKHETFEDKPKPPTKEHILADLSTSDENDVIFHTHYPTPEPLRATTMKGNTSKDSSPTEETEKPDQPDPAVINFTYEQVTKLLQLHSQLLDEPQKLQEQYEHLEKLGEGVSQSITELKQTAESILHKVKKKKK